MLITAIHTGHFRETSSNPCLIQFRHASGEACLGWINPLAMKNLVQIIEKIGGTVYNSPAAVNDV
jgi:hypothetical protein